MKNRQRLMSWVSLLSALMLVLPLAAQERASTAQPNVHVLAPLAMPGLDRERTLRIYLPPGYETSRKRYPVLYMHDGQNLFDAATSYAGEWGVDEALNTLAKSQGLELIVVGIDNGGIKRMRELNPWDNQEYGAGEGRAYMKFVVTVVKPFMDAHYRTQPERAHTAIMGSSLGGLISHFALCDYPDVFSMAGIFSPAYWFAPPVFDYTTAHAWRKDTKVYFYAGGSENADMVPNMQKVVGLVRARHFPESHLRVEVNQAADHNEAAWRAEFPRAVAWLFAAPR